MKKLAVVASGLAVFSLVCAAQSPALANPVVDISTLKNTFLAPESAAMLLYGLGGLPLVYNFLRRKNTTDKAS